MATRNEEDGGSRLWRGMRHLIFGDEAEPTLRDEIEEAIDEAEDSRPVAGDLSQAERQMLRNLLHFGEHTAGDICVTRGDIIAIGKHFPGHGNTSVNSHVALPVVNKTLAQLQATEFKPFQAGAARLEARAVLGPRVQGGARASLRDVADLFQRQRLRAEDDGRDLAGAAHAASFQTG